MPTTRRQLAIVLIISTSLFMAPVQAGAILPSLGLYGGVAKPLLNGGHEGAATGVRGNAFFGALPFISLGPEIGFYKFNTPGGTEPAWSGANSYGLAVRLGPPVPVFSPYAIGGLGLYAWNGENRGNKSALGMSLGAGLEFGPPLIPLKFGLEGRWHGKANTSPSWKGERNFWTVMAGVRLTL